jgi:tetratricopeptide (TPR) repeat protein
LGIAFTTIGEPSIGGGYTRKAYELRNQTSEQEKYYISAIFHKEVTGDLEKAEQSCKLWIQAYPRAEGPHIYLSGAIYPGLGYYEKAAEEAREAIHLKPDSPTSYVFLMFGYIGLNRLDEAKGVYGQALERKLNNTFYPPALYEIAFLQNDAVGMAKQVEGQRANPEWRTNCLAWKPRQPLTPGS